MQFCSGHRLRSGNRDRDARAGDSLSLRRASSVRGSRSQAEVFVD